MTARWHVLTTKPMHEAKAAAWLTAHGAEPWYPVRTVWRRIPSKRKAVAYETPAVPRYLFARFDQDPAWHVLRSSRYLTGVVCISGQPAVISEAAIMQMAQIPAVLAEKARQAEEAKRIRPGDRAVITDGPLAGFAVDVRDLTGAAAVVILPMLGQGQITIEAHRLAKTRHLA